MAGKPKKERVEITADALTVWAEQLSGMSLRQIAERHGVTDRTVSNWLAEIKNVIETPPDIEAMRQGLYALYPDALSALRHALRTQKDGQIAIRLLQGLSALVDKKELDVHDSRQLTSDQLRQGIEEIITIANQESVDDGLRTEPS